VTIQKEILSEKVALYLRTQILLGKYPKGFHLSESQLSKELSVSRGPIREAIHLLENEGLTKTPGNGRTLVKGYTPEDAKDLFRVRLTLESLAIRSLIEKSRNHDLSVLEELHLAVDQSENRMDAIRSDIEFHYRIVELSGNRTLINMWTMLKGLIGTLIEITTGTYNDLPFVDQCHADIIAALKAGDAEAAIDRLERHLRIGENMITGYLQEQQ
jgi:DNA-binding GntR family transcriptional regulator